jgi:AbiEi antitoxin C-terminal domain
MDQLSQPGRWRSLPAWLGRVVQELELAQAKTVSIDEIQRIEPNLRRSVVRQGATDLVRLGWLRPLGKRGTYEFIPGAAAGPYPSGDPWLILRAEVANTAETIHVGANSAAWLLGYAQRSPSPHIVVAPSSSHVSRLLKMTYRVIATTPAPARGNVDGLPVPTPPELFVEVAQLAPRLTLDAARGWLTRLIRDVDPSDAISLLRDRRISTRARAGYIADVCGATTLANAIAASVPLGRGPFYTGAPGTAAPFSARWRVYDTGHIGTP